MRIERGGLLVAHHRAGEGADQLNNAYTGAPGRFVRFLVLIASGDG